MFADRKCYRDLGTDIYWGYRGEVAWNKWKETEPLCLYYERLWGQHRMALQIKSTFEKPQELFKTGGLIFTIR